METSDLLFWLCVFAALGGAKWLVSKAKKNNFKGYEDED